MECGSREREREREEEEDGEQPIQPVYTTSIPAKPAQEDREHLYSVVLEPREVTSGLLSPNSATRELDDIMGKLLKMDLEIPSAPANCPPAVSERQERERGREREREREGERGREREEKRGRGSERAEEEEEGGKGAQAVKKTPPSLPGKTGSSIDALLGDLSSDMEKMGVRTSAKGQCASCGKCIVGKVVTALGVPWHPEHFVCFHCGAELASIGFFERDGQAYCDHDYHNLFSPRCAYCNGPILQNIVSALGKTWHPEHFFCTECGEPFGEQGFLEKEGKPYCLPDFYRLFAPKCFGCDQPVREKYLSAANQLWHPECFVCTDCLSPCSDGCFYEIDSRPLCPLHYHARKGLLCGGCRAPISGRCVSAMGKRFHPEHFVCAFCLKQLNQGVFKEQNEKPYCAGCHEKLFV
ncbi:paxillin isoform X2 [Polyodon spathula]|nr:paxillin isoform X2 [Polyodon spathula]